MVVNDDAYLLNERVALETFASKLAPTKGGPVGASLLAMVVNDDAYFLNRRVALGTFASKLAPTKAPCVRRPAVRCSVFSPG